MPPVWTLTRNNFMAARHGTAAQTASELVNLTCKTWISLNMLSGPELPKVVRVQLAVMSACKDVFEAFSSGPLFSERDTVTDIVDSSE